MILFDYISECRYRDFYEPAASTSTSGTMKAETTGWTRGSSALSCSSGSLASNPGTSGSSGNCPTPGAVPTSPVLPVRKRLRRSYQASLTEGELTINKPVSNHIITLA